METDPAWSNNIGEIYRSQYHDKLLVVDILCLLYPSYPYLHHMYIWLSILNHSPL